MALEILDCTIRDGGYVNNWQFSRDLVREVYRALSKGGVDFVELGFRNAAAFFRPESQGIWRLTTEEVLQDTLANIHGARVSVMADFNSIELQDFGPAGDSCVDLVRVAVHKNKVFAALDMMAEIKKCGYLASLQCMGYNTYTTQEKKELLNAVRDSALDYIYLADSYGSIFPFHMEDLFGPYVELGGPRVGFHPHNNIQMAFANSLEAIRVGVDIVDTTIYGIGRGAGNLPTEIMLSYLSEQGATRYNVIPILNCIERFFLDLKQEHPWGYQLPYMISGIFNIHPSYAKDLLRRKEYSMEDIWKALGNIKHTDAIGYDSEIIENFIRQGILGRLNETPFCPASDTNPDETCVAAPPVPYADRHRKREFLVLANGPSLKEKKPEIEKFIAKYDPVVLGANFLNGLFKPDYHAFNNKKRFAAYAGTTAPDSELLIGINIPPDMIDDYVQRSWEPLVFRNVLDADFDIQDGMIMCNCRTISVLLIGIAVVMGANRVFVAGMDGYLNHANAGTALFYDEKFDPQEHELNVERHRWNDTFLQKIDRYIQKQGGEGIHILTPTGHASFYKGIENYL
ncbi:MAG: hypothetical protein [Olavius algarvensis Delta 4 endosymbiont]|nr:MAG: hypothetical protein [Olavius algarvensis Delta 4 endosymbiont]